MGKLAEARNYFLGKSHFTMKKMRLITKCFKTSGIGSKFKFKILFISGKRRVPDSEVVRVRERLAEQPGPLLGDLPDLRGPVG